MEINPVVISQLASPKSTICSPLNLARKLEMILAIKTARPL
jgi:hypothetical protein